MEDHVLLKEGIPSLIFTLAVTIIFYLIYPWLAILGIGLILFVLYFFRDPKRSIPEDQNVILSAADGLITDVKEVEEPKFIKGKAIRVSIFMSPVDVHINRSPIAGKVDFIEYQKGRFISATKPESHDVNEKNFIGIVNDNLNVLVVQIAGIMARRIVNWTEMNQELNQGEKIGMIKFSSGTQIFLPIETEVLVKKGDKVASGITIIGRY